MDDTVSDHLMADAIREGIADAVRLGIGHAIAVIADYAQRKPDSARHCEHLVALLRSDSVMVAAESQT